MEALLEPRLRALPRPQIRTAAPAARWLSVRRVARVAVTVALAVVSLVLAAIVLPRAFGYAVLDVQGASMGNAYPIGSLALARPVPPGDVEVGDVVALGTEGGTPVLHRVVERERIDGRVIVRTRGDANATADAEPSQLTDPAYVATTRVPYVGYAVGFVTTPMGWVLLIVFPAGLLAARSLVRIWSRS